MEDMIISDEKEPTQYHVNFRKRLDFHVEYVVHLTSDMEVRSFFYARKC